MPSDDEPLVTARSGETFTWQHPVQPQEDDMITATDTGITYVFRNGSWEPITWPSKDTP